MNKGEKNELLFKIYLCFLKRKKNKYTIFGEIKSLGFGEKEYSALNKEIDFENLNEEKDLKKLCDELRIEKSSPLSKADVHVNKIGYSIKYMSAAPPSIINHTTRKGFLRIATKLDLNISELDGLIDVYWELRNSKKITEDCGNNNKHSPFKKHKEILRPYLEYFCFNGTGSKDSKHPADSVVKFHKFNDPSTWKIYSKKETVDEIWDGLYFCMRDIGKGGVKDYKNSPDIKKLSPWTRYNTKKYRGALSVRYKSK